MIVGLVTDIGDSAGVPIQVTTGADGYDFAASTNGGGGTIPPGSTGVMDFPYIDSQAAVVVGYGGICVGLVE